MKIITDFRQLQRARLTNKYVEIKVFYKALLGKIKTCKGIVIEVYTKNTKKIITTQEEGTIIISKGSNFEIKIYENEDKDVIKKLDLSRSTNELLHKTSKGDVCGGDPVIKKVVNNVLDKKL